MQPEDQKQQRCQNSCFALSCKCEESWSIIQNRHLPVTYSFCLIDSEGVLVFEESRTFDRPVAGVAFLKRLIELEETLLDYIDPKKSMSELTREQQLQKSNTKLCNHCNLPLEGEKSKTKSSNYNGNDFFKIELQNNIFLTICFHLLNSTRSLPLFFSLVRDSP